MSPALSIDDDVPPPPSHPPPLLSDSQIQTLAYQGHLPLPLTPSLANLYSRLSAASTTFFDQSIPTKKSLYAPQGGTELGYVSIPGEKEYMSFRALTSHASDSELEQLAAEIWQETYTLLYRVLGDLAYAMGIGHEVWDKVIDGVSPMPRKLEDATPTLLRMFRYDEDKGIAERHTDLGLLTLCVCEGKGLQVMVRGEDGKEEWTEYSEPTLLVGQTLRLLSGNRVRAGVHRVEGNPEGRGSTVFALRPSTKNEVDMEMFPGGEGKLHMGTLWKTIWSGAYNVNAPKDVRARQKERQKMTGKGQSVAVDQDADHRDDVTNSIGAITA